MNQVNLYYYFSLFTLLLINATSMAASFDCNRATTQVEQLICNDSSLSKADERMATAYFQLRQLLTKTEMALLQEDQLKWLKQRNLELRHCETPHCQLHFYEVRIQQLDVVEVNFNCDKATSKIEPVICASRLLQQADAKIFQLYQSLQKELQADQESWLKQREVDLLQPDCDLPCAWQFFKERIEFLVRYSF
jgi:uncharacterized protein